MEGGLKLLFDFLKLINRLVLREDSNGLVNVVGLVEMQIKSVAQLKKVIKWFSFIKNKIKY